MTGSKSAVASPYPEGSSDEAAPAIRGGNLLPPALWDFTLPLGKP